MTPARRRCYRRRPALLLAGLALATATWAQPAEEERPDSGLGVPPGLQVDWQGTLKQTEDGGALFTGPVTMVWRESRIQADRLSLRERRYIEAEGNVLIVWGQNRVFGARMTYDLETERGVIEEAIGYALDEYVIWARKIEKIGDKKLRLKDATITTCTQPLPYWSFAVSSATVTLEKYARMWNVRFRALKAPLVYLPYLIWPVKEDRAAGLLMPEFTSTQRRGQVFTQPLFLPLGRSADLTLIGRHYTEAGFMSGAELRFVPNQKGSGYFNGFFIDDKVEGRERYRVDYRQTQDFRNGFRMVADVGLVSDPEYFPDFERDLNLASSPQSRAQLEFSRNGSWTSLNVRELRREQLSTGLVQSSYPEVELRGRNRKLGKTPLYLSFETSVASIQQQGESIDADYLRGDVAPVLSLPYSPSGWFDITPRVAYRWTHWTQHETEQGLQDSELTRQLVSYGVEIVGPRSSGSTASRTARGGSSTPSSRVSPTASTRSSIAGRTCCPSTRSIRSAAPAPVRPTRWCSGSSPSGRRTIPNRRRRPPRASCCPTARPTSRSRMPSSRSPTRPSGRACPSRSPPSSCVRHVPSRTT